MYTNNNPIKHLLNMSTLSSAPTTTDKNLSSEKLNELIDDYILNNCCIFTVEISENIKQSIIIKTEEANFLVWFQSNYPEYDNSFYMPDCGGDISVENKTIKLSYTNEKKFLQAFITLYKNNNEHYLKYKEWIDYSEEKLFDYFTGYGADGTIWPISTPIVVGADIYQYFHWEINRFVCQKIHDELHCCDGKRVHCDKECELVDADEAEFNEELAKKFVTLSNKK